MVKRNITIGSRIIIAFISIVLFTSIILSIFGFNLSSLKNDHSRMSAIQTLVEADRDAYQSNLALSFILNPLNFDNKELVDKELGEVTANLGQVITRFNIFYDLYKSTGAAENFDHFNGLHQNLKDKTENLEKLIKSNKQTEATVYYFTVYRKSFDTLRDEINVITELTLEEAAQESNKVDFLTDHIIIITFSIFLLLSLYLIVVGFFIIRSIVRPIKSTTDILTNSVNSLTSFAGNITDSSRQIAGGATEQASQIEEIAASVEELTATVKHNYESATTTSRLSDESSNSAKHGFEEMEKMLEAMKEINDSSGEIKKVIKVIDDIAFQTNILALNAAVEAARAGEKGMGFAVVADEVKNLATRSSLAAKNTAEMIESSIKRSDNGLKIANSLITTFESILQGLIKVSEMAGEVEKASEEQTKGLEQVNRAMVEFDSVIQSNAGLSEETASSAAELNNLANKIEGQLAHLIELVKGEQQR